MNYNTQDVDTNIDRLARGFIRHIKKMGYGKITFKNGGTIVRKIVRLLFDAQDHAPMFHIEGTQLPLCWNNPRDWKLDYIKYEWGHLISINQNPSAAYSITNLALYSARCNRHIQTSLDIQELMIYGGILAQRISNVLTKRKVLFLSNDWKSCLNTLNEIQNLTKH